MRKTTKTQAKEIRKGNAPRMSKDDSNLLAHFATAAMVAIISNITDSNYSKSFRKWMREENCSASKLASRIAYTAAAEMLAEHHRRTS